MKTRFDCFQTLAAVLSAACMIQSATPLHADPFTAGNIAIFQADASASNTTASVIELSPTTAGQIPTNSIVIDGVIAPNSLRFSGSATSTGYLTNTADGSLVCFTGGNTTTSGTTNINTILPRGVGAINASGAFSLAATYTGTSGQQTRSATSLDNSTWFIADQAGIYTSGATAASPAGNFRGIKSFGGTVYVAQASSTVTVIQVSTLSAATGGTVTGLPGLTNLSSMQDFYLISSGANGSTFDVLYVIGATSNTAGTLYKYSLVSGSWVANGTLTTTFGGFGLAAKKSGAGAELFVSTGQGALAANNVLKITDTAGHNAALTINAANNVTLYTAPTGKIVKGVAFAPVAVTPTADLVVSNISAPATAITAANFSYSITVNNTGTLSTTGVAANFTIPAGLSFASASGTNGFTGINNAGTVQFTGGSINGSSSATLTVTVNTNTAATYTAAIGSATVDPANTITESNETNNANTAAATTVVSLPNVPPSFTTHPGSVTIATGYTATLSVTATGLPAPTFQWYQGNSGDTSTPVGTNSSSFTTPALTTTTSYWVRATNSSDTANSNTATVTVTTGPTSVNLANYVRIGRHNLPEPTRTTPPLNNLLGQEASGVTYNWDTDTLFIVGDGGTSVTEVTKTGALVGTMTLPPGGSSQGTEFFDTEGISYIGGGQFVLTEERDRQAVRFTYVAGGTLLRSAAQTMKLGTTIGNLGLEGLSWDPQTSGYIFVKEAEPLGIFQTTIDFVNSTASNGSPTTVNSTNLFDPALASLEDMSDVFAFSNLPSMTGQPAAGNLLILSQESGMIRQVDRAGNIVNTMTLVADAGNPLSIQNQTHEGITMDRAGFIYVVSENGGGDSFYPQLWVYGPSTVTNVAPTALALSTPSTTIPASTPTTSPIKMATIVVTDADGVGVNNFSATGPDANDFQFIGTGLYLKAGTVLNGITKPTYNVTVNVDDTTVGGTPDASASFTLNVTGGGGSTIPIRVTEVAPWSSGNSALAADWFELTNTGTTAVNISGWKMFDNGAGGFGSSGPLTGITSIAPGESVIFVDGQAKVTAFVNHWFGGTAPPGFQIGYYGGPGLSTGGDAVTIYDPAGTLQARVDFVTSPSATPFGTFDNTAGLNNVTVTQLSAIGTNGAFSITTTTPAVTEIGSPGTATLSSTVLVSITATDAAAAETGIDAGTFRISRTGGTTTLALDVVYTIATGSGQATSADYTPTLVSPATIPAGASFVDLTITPVDDALFEGSETVTLTLGDTGSYDVGSPATATVTITDNEVNMAPTAVAFANTVAALSENASTVSDVRVADITITDDGNGTNTLGLSGTDASFFTLIGNSLYLKAGTALSFATKPSYTVTVNVDDSTVGSTPDATANFTLAISQFVAPGTIVITEVHPTGSNATYAADWFELTNTGSTAMNITGWQVDDNSNGSLKIALRGVTSIPAGKTVVFIEGLADGSTDATIIANFSTAWFGSATLPPGVLIGTYGGSGIGFGSGGDAVNIFNAAGDRVTGVAFGAATTGTTFDNKTAALGSTTLPLPIISTLSVIGTNGAFRSAANTETGSPGSTVTSSYFPQSVASGDPRSASVVLWTRVLDGHTAANRSVTLHLTTTGTIADVGNTTALGGTNVWTGGALTAQSAHDGVVKVKLSGLTADTTYYYQFTYNGQLSPVGRTKTAPAAGSTRTVKYAAINCNDFVGRYFNVLRQLAEREQNTIDFVLNLGDYVYETTGDPSFQTTLPERAMVFSNPAEAINLGGGNYAAQSVGNYRDVYKTIRQDAQLRRVHELFPMISIWDDHEFSDDNWKDNATYFDGKVNEQQTNRKKNGEQAWMEFLPTERGMAATGNGLEIDSTDLYPNTVIYDAFNFGTNLDLILTDIRTNRADHLIPEDACPSGIPMTETDLIATLAAVNGLSVPAFTAAAWPGIRGSFAPYVDIDAPAYSAVKAGFKAIIAASVNSAMASLPAGQTPITTGAAYADANVVGFRDAGFINQAFVAAGQSAPFDAAALAAMPRGLSYYLLGKTSVFSDFGSRYQVVNQTFQLFAGYTYQAFIASSGAIGRDQAFYNTAQQTFLATALANSTAAGNKWRVVASSTPYTPIKFELGDLPAGVTLPTQGTISGVTIPASLPSQFLVEFLLNADEPAGFPQFRQGMIDLFAQHDAIIVSGDIHAELIGRNNATNGQKVVDFTVPSAASSEFRKAVSGAFTTVEGLMTPGVQVATGLPGSFAFDTTQKQAVINATDTIIKHNTPEMFQADTASHGYTVFTVGSSAFNADYQKINVSEIDDNLYALSPSALNAKFTTQSFAVSKTGAGPSTDLAISEVDYTLQVLHYYGESGLLGIQTAPIMGAMIDKFDNEYANTVVLGEGDSFIPGPWLVGGADPSLKPVLGLTGTDASVALGRPDIAIMNAFGTTASALGNHEFDLGSPVLSSAVSPQNNAAVTGWVGAQFPLITANLNFAGDASLRGLADATLGGTGTNAFAGLETSSIKAKIAPYAIKTLNGQKIGFVGATTWDLLSKTSPNGTVPKDDANAATDDLQEVAAYVQGAINALNALGVNKIVMIDQLDTLQRNKDLAGLVTGIDVMVAGGGHERMGDATDTAVAFSGHDANFIGDAYPIVTAGADGAPTLIVTTDTEYSYLGRLVVDFDADGRLILPNLSPVVNGAYAASEATLQTAYGTSDSAATIISGSLIGSKVKTITDAINNVIITKDGTIYGYTNVYLEGDRVFGRTQEVNLGNLSADANAAAAKTALGLPATAPVFSLKNGGGIRASLGSVLADGTKVGPLANPLTGKPANAISQLDVENALRFDNKMMTCEMTPQGLLNILNFAAGLSSGPTQQSGGYPQVGNIRFSYDYAQTAARVRTVVLLNDNGDIVARVVDNGVVRTDAPALIRAVILNFTANGGDGYPIKANADNFRYLLTGGTLSGIIDESLDFTAAANVPANALGEQKIFADYVTAKHGSVVTAYNVADTPVALDTRIQQLSSRSDTVNAGTVFMPTFAFSASTATVKEGAGKVTLTINRTSDLAAASVNISTANGTATAGTDYTALVSVPVSFALNETSKTVDVNVAFRSGIQGSRTFTATLSGAETASPATTTVTITEADTFAASSGPSSSATPYVLPLNGNWQTKSILTVGDGPGGYQMAGIPDGLGAYDNGDGTLTLLMNHELGKTVGVTRAHGAIGSFVSEWVINKSTLAVVSGSDLMRQVYQWNTTTQASETTTSTIAFSRFCSADLPAVSAFYNAATGLGTQTRIFMNGEESTGGGSNGLGYVVGHVATGPDKGKSYILGKFNAATDGNTNGVTGWGGWENVVASPYPQDKTVVVAPSDGGTAGTPHSNSVVVYVGTKTNTGSEVDKAGLTNGVMKFVNVTGNPAEIVNTTTRATNITSGTAFTLSATAATTFSRPEDGSWDPTNPNHFYFVTTDQRDDVNDGLGAQVGRTRLWRLKFTSITTPELGGTIDLVLTGGSNVPAGNDANMWDNMTVTSDGKLMLQEDVGGAAHNGKVWFYDPTTGSLTKVLKHDVARFGDREGGVTTLATAPYSNDEETSGVIDVTSLFGGNALTGDRTYLMVDQAHYTTGISAANVEGGQLLLVRQTGSVTGPTTTTPPYVLSMNSDFQVNSILSVGEGPGGYQMAGIPDGLGAYDNGDGTLTLLMNHELGKTVGATRAHGAIGAFVSEWVINKSTLAVVSGSDLMRQVYDWNATTQASNTTTSTIAFSRFCSADLPAVSAFYNAATGKGTQTRIFMNGEESTGGGSNGLGYVVGHVATGTDKGKSYILGKFNAATDGNTNGVTGWGGWENVVASPYPQDKTVVVAPSDGGTAGTPHSNSVVVYVGTKTNTGSEVDKAGLTNGVMKFVNVTGNPAEIVNTTTRATNITSGTAFTLSATAATTFSRPEDGSWDPTNPNHFYFVTTDRLDQVQDGIGAQIGRTRLWRLNFTNITTPEVGGTIDLVLTGGVGNDANMWDNMTVTNDGKLMLQEDVGGAPHNGKVWFYDPATGSLTKVLQHNPALFGDLTTPATLPYTNDEETSGVIDVSAIFGSNAAAGQRTYLMVDQAHYTTGISAANVEGGQLLLVRQTPKIAFSLAAATSTVTENAGNLVLAVNRFGDLQYGATVNVSTSNGTAIAGTDYTVLSNLAVTFAPGETSKSLSISIANRSGAQADRTFTVSLTGPAAPGVLGAPSTTTVTIIDTASVAFAAWLTSNGYTGALGGDSDGDGVPDMLEYFFNANPNDGNDRDNLPKLVINGNDLEFRFTYLSSAAFPGYLKSSEDLINWVSATPGVDYEVISEQVNGVETAVRFRIFSNPTPTATGPFTYLTPFNAEVDRGALNQLTITNHGMVGAGRMSGESLDSFGETQGAASGLSITGWNYNSGTGQFSGTFNVLPDRGYNNTVIVPNIYSNYATRIHAVPFTFTPYYGAGPVAQTQIVPTYSSTTKFTYLDGSTTKFTTGLNPTAVSTLFGQSVGTVPAFNLASGTTESLLSFDAEAIHVFADGSGFVSDEYGTYIARFNAAKQFTRIIQLPASAQPHKPVGTLNFEAAAAPLNGRRNNQGLEGLSVSPDNKRLFALLQSATVQDTSGSLQQTRFNTRLYVYDIEAANLENPVLIGEYVVQLPRYKTNGNGAAADATAAQSEIVAISNTQFLMLPRDGNGLGKSTADPIVTKTVDLVDFSSATNVRGIYDAEGNQISPAGNLRATITPAKSTVVINLLSTADLTKFGFNTNTASPNQFTVAEKIEAMSLVPDTSTVSTEDYFLFVANDNDFQSSDVKMLDATGNIVSYGDARSSVSGSPKITNDAVFTAWRITITPNNRKFFLLDVSTAP